MNTSATWRERLAWAAGIFDGEGWIGTGLRSGRRYPRLAVGQIDRVVLDKFQHAVGVGHVHGPYAYARRKTPIYYYETSGCHRVRAVIAMLWTWLSPTKRSQALRTFATVDQSEKDGPPRRGLGTTCRRGHPFTRYGKRNRCKTCEAKWNHEARERRLVSALLEAV